MEYVTEYELKMLDLIKKYSEEEYEELTNAPMTYTVDHLDWLGDKYPTLEEFEKYCQETWGK